MLTDKEQERQNAIVNLAAVLLKAHPDAIIAGGFARDLYGDRPIKDIDMYISREKFNPKEWSYFSPLSRLAPDPSAAAYGFEVEVRSATHSLYDVSNTIIGAVEVQVIIVDMDPIHYVYSRFDLPICEAIWTRQGPQYSQGFLRDMANKTITLDLKHLTTLPRNSVGKCIQEHLPRIMQKYPDHKVVTRSMYED